MSESKSPSNFITPSSIDSLSIAGACVWLIILSVQSLVSDMTSFWIRIVAICLSILWSLSLFLKNKKWNKAYNYIIIIVNSALIYVNAAGYNTVTRQSPFEGYGVKTDIRNLKTPIQNSGFLNLSDQKNWNPDYQMIKYIDTLKLNLKIETSKVHQLQNEFSYFKDNIDFITNDPAAKANIKKFLQGFGNSYFDSSDFAIMKKEFQLKIDSLTTELKFRNENPITRTISTTYEINGKKLSAENYIDTLLKENSQLQNKILINSQNRPPNANAGGNQTIQK